MTNGWVIRTLCLLFCKFLSLLVLCLSEWNRECFRECLKKNVWGTDKIQLLDTTFWSRLSLDPERFVERFRRKVNLLECDFVVMPMFEMYAFFLLWKEAINQIFFQESLEAGYHWEAWPVSSGPYVSGWFKGGVLRLNKHCSVFHILDSMSNSSQSKIEANRLQDILLKYYEGEIFQEGRISANFAQVNPFFLSFFCSA